MNLDRELMSNYQDLKGKVVLITGASSGIGRSTAVAFAECGASVAINYHQNQSGAEAVRAKIEAAGVKAVAIQADVSLIERLKILELTEERWDEVIDLNLKSAFLCCRAVAASMMERKSGAIINVSSIAGRTGGALGAIHYSAAKSGLITLTKGLAKELAPFGVRVNAVSPGVIDTRFHEEFSSAETMKAYVAAIPLGRVGTPEEVAKVICFLASDAASYLAGETIEINGGMFMD